MRIGVMPVTSGDGGGIYQYSRALVDAMTAIRREALSGDELVGVTHDLRSPVAAALRDSGWEVVGASPPNLGASARRVLRHTPARRAVLTARKAWRARMGQDGRDPDAVRKNPALTRWLRRNGIDLMIYPFPVASAFEVDVPAVVAVHDLQHRLQPHFPEVSAGGEAAAREYLFRNIARSARLILVDSVVGKEDVLACYAEYGVREEDIFVLPFVAPPETRRPVSPAEVDRVRARYALPDRYAFYPAAFWPHKNHARLFEALAELEATGDGLDLVLVGAVADTVRRAAYESAMTVADRGGVPHRLHHLGFVPEQDMAPLYAGARALLFPTFFGPTNIPVIEAWAHDVPVLTSDIRGIREQCGEAAILVDPSDVAAITAGIRAVWSDDIRRAHLVLEGQRQLSRYGVEEHRALVAEMVQAAKARITRGQEDGCR